jgi:Fis family transcriptional regulator, factor for inversion stimulation protein
MDNITVSYWIEQRVGHYFRHLDGANTTNVYDMIIKEVDAGILKAVLKHTQGNQSLAASILGISRVTLKKKMQSCEIDCFEETS